jgi:flagellar assembly protein FliH
VSAARVIRDQPWPPAAPVALGLPAVDREANTPAPAAPDPGQAMADARAAGYERGLADAQARIAADFERRDAQRQAQAEAARAGMARAEQERGEHVQRVLAQLGRAHEQALHDIERQAAALAFEAVCRVLAPAVDDPRPAQAALAAAFVRQAMAATHGGAAQVALRLHPRDLQALGAGPAHDLAPHVRWIADPRCEPLSVVLEGRGGRVEAGLEHSLGQLRSLWAEALAAGSAGGPPTTGGGP